MAHIILCGRNSADPLWRLALDAVCARLLAGDIVGVPTETVYGLAADATSNSACARIFAAKARPQENPLICHVHTLEAAQRHAIFSPGAEHLARAFWPGPLTLILPARNGGICARARAGAPAIALRVPCHGFMCDIARTLDRPVAAPSANRSGRITATSAEAVHAELGAAISLIIDDGPSRIGLESTIVAFDEEKPRLLRPGGVPVEAIAQLLGQELAPARPDIAAERRITPGSLASHYAPRARLRLSASSARRGEAFLAFGAICDSRLSAAMMSENLSACGDLTEAANGLFAALRRLDASGADVIAVMEIPDTGLGAAINDRLKRAAAPRTENQAATGRARR